MLNIVQKLVIHVVPFMTVIGQVVTIWGFLNFINQLNLQNLTLVADRALGRLPGLKNAIFVLKNCSENEIDQSLENVNEITKRLFMDLKQLGIAHDYDMKSRIGLVSQRIENMEEARMNYLTYELGSDWNVVYKASFYMPVPFLLKLENELLDIFDLSHSSQTFTNHLATNVIRISWISLVIYLVECQNFMWSGSIFLAGAIIFSAFYIKNWRNN